MKRTIRILIPRKKGLLHRIAGAIAEAHATVEHSRVTDDLRGMSVADYVVSCGEECSVESIRQSLGGLGGVIVLSVSERCEERQT